jgi:hypothetical protein
MALAFDEGVEGGAAQGDSKEDEEVGDDERWVTIGAEMARVRAGSRDASAIFVTAFLPRVTLLPARDASRDGAHYAGTRRDRSAAP